MVDYYPIRSTNGKLPEPAIDAAARGEPAPIIDVVYNDYSENGKGRTVAVKVPISLPNASRCSHCEAVAHVTGYSRNHMKKEA